MIAQQLMVEGETFVGLIGLATDKYAILSPQFRQDDALGVPTLKTKAYGTNLIGMFCQGNSNGILLPYFVTNEELQAVKDFASKLGVAVGRVNEKYTALGNMIACNDRAAFVADEIRDYKEIKDVLGVEVLCGDIGGRMEIGAYVLPTNKGFIAHPDAEKKLQELESIFKVKGMVGTVNCGVPYVKSGLIANSNGYITGMRTTGIELQRIEDALGLF
jgi:translation initiation factor 6